MKKTEQIKELERKNAELVSLMEESDEKISRVAATLKDIGDSMDPFSRENNIYDGILVDADFIDKSTQSFTMSSTGMSPSIAMGDVVLYQPLKENQKFHDHKCVVEIDGDMTVKIIQKLMTTGKYSLISTGPGNVKDFFKEEDIGGVVKILGIVIGKVTKRLY